MKPVMTPIPPRATKEAKDASQGIACNDATRRSNGDMLRRKGATDKRGPRSLSVKQDTSIRSQPNHLLLTVPQVQMAEPAPTPEGVEESIDARVVAMLPEQLLQPSEIIVLLIKPSPWYIILSSLGFLAAVAIFTAIILTLSSRGFIPWATRKDLILAAFGITAIRLFWQFLEWLSRLYVLTDQRVIRVGGVLRVQVFEAPLKNIQHTHALFSLRERFLGLGTIAFATSGTAGIETSWAMVAQPLEVHRIVVETLSRYGR